MLISVDIQDKHFGDKVLYKDLQFVLEKNEKVGVIGRNGAGKSTLFGMLAGLDSEFDGEIKTAKNTVIISTRQEHSDVDDQTVIDYILDELPQYKKLKAIIDGFGESENMSNNAMNRYSDALEQFSSLGYYTIEDTVLEKLKTYQIDESKARGDLKNLSGGQKRFVELVKIANANADLALIDEPTNHMDYVAKNDFIEWLDGVRNLAVLVITHDRDVLEKVDRIVEIKEGRALVFKGNYDSYLLQNSSSTVTAIKNYEIDEATITNLKKQIEFARARSAKGGPRWVTLRERYERELKEILDNRKKPSFWIDRESLAKLHPKAVEGYGKYKAKNIRIGATSGSADTNKAYQPIIDVDNLSLGYNDPLFKAISFRLMEGDKLRFHGRNGAGKTTLIKSILAVADDEKIPANIFAGTIEVRPKLAIGTYEQEISDKYLDLSLEVALEQLYLDKNLPINDQKIRQLMSDYLFNPITDAKVPLNMLSGGQKARFQLISMLANNPQLLILDEPTNHLDLPSIEELENAIHRFTGAIIFVSHDGFFVKGFEHETLLVGNQN